MKKLSLIHAAGLTAAAVLAAGVLWFAFHRPSTEPACIQQLQQLATPAVAVTSIPFFIDILRSIKAFLVRNPAVKSAYAPATFSWRRDVFDRLTTLFSQVLQQKPDQAALAKILSLADAIVDEFEADNAGKQYNAEVDVAAQAWRNNMYDAIRTQAEQVSTGASSLQSLGAGITTNRGAIDLTQKVLLKDKKLPMTRPVITPPAAQPNTVQNNDQITQEQRSQAYDADAYDYHSGYDVAAPGYDAFMPEQKSLHTAAAGTTSKPRSNKSIQKTEHKATDSATTAATTQQATATTTTADSSPSTTTAGAPSFDSGINSLVSDGTVIDREAEKQDIIDLQAFMKDFQALHKEKERETMEAIEKMGIF